MGRDLNGEWAGICTFKIEFSNLVLERSLQSTKLLQLMKTTGRFTELLLIKATNEESGGGVIGSQTNGMAEANKRNGRGRGEGKPEGWMHAMG
jgi:hypothetical protein